MFTKLFPLWVSLSAIIALINPVLFTWFSGPWITYGLGGIMLGMGLTLQWQDFPNTKMGFPGFIASI